MSYDLNFSTILVKTIIQMIEEHNSIETNTKIGSIEILDYLDIKSNETLISALVKEIAQKDRKYIAKLLLLLLGVLSINHKEILIQAVEIDDNIFIYTQEQIEKYNNAYYSLTEEQQRDYISYLDEKEDPKYIDESRILNYKNIGPIYFSSYYPNDSFIKVGIKNSDSPKYNHISGKFEYTGKVSNFSLKQVQGKFIYELYNNLNQPINAEKLKLAEVKNPSEILKNIREKLESEIGINKFTGLETRTLLTSFTYNKTQYFTMHG